MSLRGFKKSIPDTKAAHFKDRRSFRSIDGHDLLFGEDKRLAAAEYTPSETRMEYLGCRANGIICATNIIGCDDVIVQRAACG